MSTLLHRSVLLFACAVGTAHAWSFTPREQPEGCIGMEFAISGGVPPYNFTTLHAPNVPYDQIANISAWSSGISTTWTFNSTTSPSGIGTNYVAYTPLIIVGSDATGFASGGTTQAYTVLPEAPPRLPGCSPYPGPNNTDYLNYLQSFSTNLTECGNVSMQLKNLSAIGPDFWIDTIVPLGRSFRTSFDASTGNGMYSWPLNVTVGTNVTFVFGDNHRNSFVTPIMTVQASSNAACSPSGTLSSSPAPLPTDSLLPASSAQRLGLGSGRLGWLTMVISIIAGASGIWS